MQSRILAVLWACALAGAAFAEPTIDEEQSLRMDYLTPHTAWARPYAQGVTRVLFFSDFRHSQAREIIELMERFEVKADAVYYSRLGKAWHGEQAGIERCLKLLEQPYDVYLFNQLPLTLMTAEMQYKLLQRVADGAGLVLLGGKDPRVLKKPIPRQAGDPEAELYAIRNGRGALLPAIPTIDYRFGWETEYDYAHERLGRTVLWAAGKAPKQKLAIELPAAKVDRAALPAVVGTLSANPSRVRVRRLDGTVVSDLSRGAQRAVKLGKVPAGSYRLDAWSGDGWATVPFEVTAARTVEVALKQTFGEVGEVLAGTVALGGEAAAGEQVKVELTDRRGRVLAASGPAAPTDGQVVFAFPVPAHTPMLVRVRAAVVDAGGEVADGEAYYNVVKRHRGQFNFVIWDIPAGPAGPLAEARLAELGMTVQLRGAPPPRVLAAYDIAYVPYTTRILDDKDDQGHIKPVPWNQEPEIDEYVAGIVEKYRGAREHGVFVYSLGDETVTRGSDSSPSDLAAYQAYLKDVYGGLPALNQSWGSEFTKWDEIQLLDPKDPRELTAKQQGNYARWYDRQAWECRNFINFCGRFVEAYKRLDPQARTGFEGAGRFAVGDDLDGIVRGNTFWSPYPGLADYVIRSIAPRDFPRGNWMGYTKDAAPLIDKYWRMILNGCDSVWYWRWDGIGEWNGILKPDLSVFPQIDELLRDTRITREGLGDLLLRYQQADDGIAILYSMPSAYAVTCADGPGYGTYEQAHQAWITALENLGLGFRYVTDAMLRNGELGAGTKVLLLPRAEALSDREAAVIADFVKAGGTVIADVRPGRYDGHCKPRVNGALDDLFSVVTRSKPALTDATVKVALPPGGPAGTWELAAQVTDPGVAPKTMVPLGGNDQAPALMVHQLGRGQAIYLNLGAAQLAAASTPAIAAVPGANTLLGQWLKAAGVAPEVKLVRPLPAEPTVMRPNVRVVRWTEVPNQLVAIQAQVTRAGAEKVQLKLDSPRRVYDLKAGRDLGEVALIEPMLQPGRAEVYALLPPGTAPKVVAALDNPRVPRGATPVLSLKIDGSRGAHAVLVTGARPDGSDADWLRKVVVIDSGTATLPVPIALNDPAGKWTIGVRELFAGKVTELPLTVIGE